MSTLKVSVSIKCNTYVGNYNTEISGISYFCSCQVKSDISIEKFDIFQHNRTQNGLTSFVLFTYIFTYLAQTPEIGQGLGRYLSCGARKQEQT